MFNGFVIFCPVLLNESFMAFLRCRKIDQCSETCTKCSNKGTSCVSGCSDNTKYFQCQSDCIEAARNGTQKCIKNDGCIKKCDRKCKNLWEGMQKHESTVCNRKLIKSSCRFAHDM